MDVQNLAQEYGFDFARNTGKIWHGYAVYQLGTWEFKAMGLPMFILVKDGKIRINTHEETFEIYDYLYPPEHYEDDEENEE